jgi:hypothetical protein
VRKFYFFFGGFSEQPTVVMKRWIEQQQGSLDLILANEEIDEESASETEEEVLEEIDDDEFAKTIAGLQTSLSPQRGQKTWTGPEVDEAVRYYSWLNHWNREVLPGKPDLNRISISGGYWSYGSIMYMKPMILYPQ